MLLAFFVNPCDRNRKISQWCMETFDLKRIRSEAIRLSFAMEISVNSCFLYRFRVGVQ